MTDLHCHILPEFDDGAQTPEDSVKMLACAAKSKTDVICATPHSNCAEFPTILCDELISSFRYIKTLAKQFGITLLLGMELLYSDDLAQEIVEGRYITLNDSRYPLIEFHFDAQPGIFLRAAESLTDIGLIPIIAHPERYYAIQEDIGIIGMMREFGCLFQVNSCSMTGFFGIEARDTAVKLLAEGMVDVISSDAHDADQRSADMSRIKALLDRIDTETSTLLTETNAYRILTDSETLQPRPLRSRK